MLAHVDMDAFYAAVEVLDDPRLAGKPLVVGGGPRSVVSAASYEARRYGVRSAMPMYQALKLCPRAVVRPVRMERYRQVSAQVMEVLAGFSPLVEPVSVDEAYLDLAGTEGLWGPPPRAGRLIKQRIRAATGLTCSVGLAPVRFLAKIASDRHKPDGLTVVEEVEPFLHTVELREVPGVGAKAQARLAAMGLTRLTQLRALGRKRLQTMFGSWGRRLWDLAHGIDPTGVHPGGPPKSLSHEITLEQNTADRGLLASHLLALSQKLCRRLRARGLAGRVVVLKLRHADHRLVTRRTTLAWPGQQVEEVFPAARELLMAYTSAGPFRLIGVGLAGLLPVGRMPPELFPDPRRRQRRVLAAAEDAIVARFGPRAIFRAGAAPALDPKPEAAHNRNGEHDPSRR